MHREPPAQFVLWALGYSLELGILFDPATSSAIIEELKWTVTKWRGSYELLRVVWIDEYLSHGSRKLPEPGRLYSRSSHLYVPAAQYFD